MIEIICCVLFVLFFLSVQYSDLFFRFVLASHLHFILSFVLNEAAKRELNKSFCYPIFYFLMLHWVLWAKKAFVLFRSWLSNKNWDVVVAAKKNETFIALVDAFALNFSFFENIILSALIYLSLAFGLNDNFITWRVLSGLIGLHFFQILFLRSKFAASLGFTALFYLCFLLAHYDYWAGIGISGLVRKYGPQEMHFLPPHILWGKWDFSVDKKKIDEKEQEQAYNMLVEQIRKINEKREEEMLAKSNQKPAKNLNKRKYKTDRTNVFD